MPGALVLRAPDKLTGVLTRLALALMLWGALVSPARAEQSDASRTPAGAPLRFEKGTVEIGGLVGTALPISLFRAKPERRLTMVSFSVGRVMTRRLGRGPLGGHLELLVEATPLMLLRQPDSVFGAAVSPFFMRWNIAPLGARRARVFAEVSGGLLLTSHEVPARTTSFNFIDQGGFGVRFERDSRRAWLVGYRFQHISNGGRVRPNPGANFNFVYGGLSFMR